MTSYTIKSKILYRLRLMWFDVCYILRSSKLKHNMIEYVLYILYNIYTSLSKVKETSLEKLD
ncbi:hypothetical protein MXB_804 [Myxobolus squamalis]|nr:hypothetical protein MXB_804 [Myxobolus squamalis]